MNLNFGPELGEACGGLRVQAHAGEARGGFPGRQGGLQPSRDDGK